MTYFPRKPMQRPASAPAVSARTLPRRDVLWGRPLFQAPALPAPTHANFDPLPFTATRITHRPAGQRA